jgi:N-acetyl sugar amidotransferase
VHVWSYKALLDSLPDAPWLIKHNPPELERSLFYQVWWQFWKLPEEMRRHGCDILLNLDAGTVGRARPSIVMSRDMLCYEPGERQRYGFSKARLRLILLRQLQTRSMRRAEGVIFLTDYAASVIRQVTGPLTNMQVIPHGIGENFKRSRVREAWPDDSTRPIRCIYVSHTTMYKHQWVVVRAIARLRERGHNLSLHLVGAGFGWTPALARLERELAYSDPDGEFVEVLGPVGHREIPALLANADIFVFASSCENMPNTLVEGMAAGLPIACSNRGPMPEVLKDGGAYFDPENLQSIAEAIEKIILDREFRTSIASRAEEYSRSYSWQKCAGQTWRFLRASARELESYQPAATAVSAMVAARRTRLPEARAYRICTNCIMDTSDRGITFDAAGVCDHCRNYYHNILPSWHTGERGWKSLEQIAERIRSAGAGRDHDCLIGISGGVDSSYLTYLAKERLGLRPLVFHVDAGWNSQEAVNNIERLVDSLELDLYTHVVDWPEMRDLQLAFFKAQVPHIDTPQDHAFFAALYNFAVKQRFRYILTGANYSTECIRNPLEWHYHATDLVHLKDIHARFGMRPLVKFPLTDIFTYKIFYTLLLGLRVVHPLNYVPYVKQDAMKLLSERFGWQRYEHKHYESRFTRFYEGYWQPRKFGIDKRRRDFSSLILTRQMTREDALERIAKPAYDPETIAQDFEYVATKLDISVAELQAIMDGPKRNYEDYRNNAWLIELGTRVLQLVGVEKRAIR